jgi:TRAP-type C4-dicarboxylate transport system substrate-binding protein
VLTAWDKGFDVFSLAGLFMDVEHLQRFIASNKGGKVLEKRLQAKGLKIAYWVSAPIHIFTVKQSINKLEDVKGLKIRTQPAAIIAEAMKALGGTGVPIPIGELYTAAQTGMIDGVATQEFSIQMRKLDEVFRYCLLDPIVFFNNGASVYSIAQLGKMPPAVQKIVEEAWMETAPIHEKTLLERWTKDAHKKMLEKGMTFTTLSPEERGRFDKVWSSVRMKFAPEIGMEIYAEAIGLRK